MKDTTALPTNLISPMFNLGLVKDKLLKSIGFYQYGLEHEQANIRLVIIGLILLFIGMSYETIKLEIAYCWGIYFIFSLSVYLNTRLKPTLNSARQIVTLLMDVSATSLTVYLTSDIGGVFIAVYLWLVIGYGLRYGRTMLLIAYFACITGYSTATLLSPHWHENMNVFYGLLTALVAIPLFTLSLLTKLKNETAKAEAANKAKSQFLSHISHEIRTPLNGIVGACALLQSADSKANNHDTTLLNVMKSSSDLLLELVNNVLDLSKIESGKITSYKEDFYLQNLLINTVNLFETQANAKSLSLSYQIDTNTPLKLNGDLLHLKQVLLNLVGNAIKFTTQGSVKVTVKMVSQVENQARIRFEVSDTGIGISEGSLVTIFDSFTQAEESIKYKFGGTGLGTTISKNLVELMNGHIGVTSVQGQGSTFYFEVPLDQMINETLAEQDTSEIIAFKDFKKPVHKVAKQFHVLIADDNEINTTILTAMLDREKHTYDVVINGQLALDKLEVNHYDLMILDCNMPVMGGLETIQLYQALNIGQKLIPAIILSADATVETISAFEAFGVDAYLTKPIKMDILAQTMETVVAKTETSTAKLIEYTGLKSQGSAALIDVGRLDELAKLDSSHYFIESLITEFMEDTEKRLVELTAHVEFERYEEISDLGHTLAGSAANIGATAFAVVSHKLNDISPLDDIFTVHAIVSDTYNSYMNTKNQMLMYLEDKNAPQKRLN